jgi:hypothetical protein
MPTITKQQAIALNKPRSGIQTILVPRDRFTTSEAKHWLRTHGYNHNEMRYTSNFMRFMQTNPIAGNHYVTETLPNGIELVFMRP